MRDNAVFLSAGVPDPSAPHFEGEGDSAARQAKMVDYAGKKLDLNDAQKQRLSVLGDKLREQRASLMGVSKDPRGDFRRW